MGDKKNMSFMLPLPSEERHDKSPAKDEKK
jgi:hypothetical protein